MIENWSQLESFLALARHGTLAGAASALGSSVSTVHRHINALETALGAQLVERRGRGSALSSAGEALVLHAERIEAEVRAIGREVGGRDALARGQVLLTTTDTLAHGLLIPLMPAFRDSYPGIELTLLVDNRHYRLGRGEADLALRPGRKPHEADVVALAAGEIGYSYYASAAYLRCHSRPRRHEDLRQHAALVPDASLAQTPYGAAAEHFAPESVALRSPSLLALAAAVELGLGIAALPCFLLDGRPGITRLFRPEPEGPLWLLYHAELRHSARVRAVVRYLAEHLEGIAPRLRG